MDGVGFRKRLGRFPVLSLFPYATVSARHHFAQDSYLRAGMQPANTGGFPDSDRAETRGIFAGSARFCQDDAEWRAPLSAEIGWRAVCSKMCCSSVLIFSCDLISGCRLPLNFALCDAHACWPRGVERRPSWRVRCGLRCLAAVHACAPSRPWSTSM